MGKKLIMPPVEKLEGRRTADIKKEFDCSENTVRKWRRKYGIRSPQQIIVDYETVDRLLEEGGHTDREIAQIAGCGKDSVYYRRRGFRVRGPSVLVSERQFKGFDVERSSHDELKFLGWTPEHKEAFLKAHTFTWERGYVERMME